MEQTKITAEQVEAISAAYRAAAVEIKELWELIIEEIRKVAKILSEFLRRIDTAFRRTRLYYRLLSFKIPRIFSYWIARLMPRRLLLM
jgi:hypothetical protein